MQHAPTSRTRCMQENTEDEIRTDFSGMDGWAADAGRGGDVAGAMRASFSPPRLPLQGRRAGRPARQTAAPISKRRASQAKIDGNVQTIRLRTTCDAHVKEDDASLCVDRYQSGSPSRLDGRTDLRTSGAEWQEARQCVEWPPRQAIGRFEKACGRVDRHADAIIVAVSPRKPDKPVVTTSRLSGALSTP